MKKQFPKRWSRKKRKQHRKFYTLLNFIYHEASKIMSKHIVEQTKSSAEFSSLIFK